MTRILKAWVGPEPVVVSDLEDLVRDDGAGATVSFVGTVRNTDLGREVAELEYEAHPDASTILEEVLREVCGTWGEVVAVAAVHRTGLLQVRDVAFVACVSSVHRKEGFATCEGIVDAVKHRVPVWKRQVFADGGQEWVNTP